MAFHGLNAPLSAKGLERQHFQIFSRDLWIISFDETHSVGYLNWAYVFERTADVARVRAEFGPCFAFNVFWPHKLIPVYVWPCLADLPFDLLPTFFVNSADTIGGGYEPDQPVQMDRAFKVHYLNRQGTDLVLSVVTRYVIKDLRFPRFNRSPSLKFFPVATNSGSLRQILTLQNFCGRTDLFALPLPWIFLYIETLARSRDPLNRVTLRRRVDPLFTRHGFQSFKPSMMKVLFTFTIAKVRQKSLHCVKHAHGV